MNETPITIRRMTPGDLSEVDRIQRASPEASHWRPDEYLVYESFVAVRQGRPAGFAVARLLPPDEVEILNVATAPEARRRGVARALLQALLKLPGRFLFLEVRESNAAARALYRAAGFVEAGRRKGYYPSLASPSAAREDAVVMKMQK